MTDRRSTPVGLHGPYLFGMPDVLIRIHFPHAEDSDPWFWWITVQQPEFYQYIGPQAGGGGWQRTPNFPLIKILPIDTQQLRPTPVVGWADIGDAIEKGGLPANQAFGWGRFKFTDKFFWRVINGPQSLSKKVRMPEFKVVRGRPTKTTRGGDKTPIAEVISEAVNRWLDYWNFGVQDYNIKAVAAVAGSPAQPRLPFPSTKFKEPLPFEETVAFFRDHPPGTYYYGPVPLEFTKGLSGNLSFIVVPAYSYTMNIKQLHPDDWNLSKWPPVRNKHGFVTDDCSGYSPLPGLTFPKQGLSL